MPHPVIYQVFPRYFGNTGKNIPHGSIHENNCGKFNDFTPAALQSILSLGCTHIWYTGILEHATQTSYTAFGIADDHPAVVKGKAGSPYAIRDYYDVDPDLAVHPAERFAEFMQLLDRTHQAGLKALIDFVPNHVARRYASDSCPPNVRDLGADDRKDCAFHPDNNFYYLPGQSFHPSFGNAGVWEKEYVEFPARATGNDCFTASPGINDWYETVKLNYGVDYQTGTCHFNPVPATWFKMLDILKFWAGQGVDGFRCDMAEMVPVEFWEWAISRVKEDYPAVLFVAEVYQPSLYRDYIHRGGFDYLYDKVGIYDVLKAVMQGHAPASSLTGCWQAVNDVSEYLLHFLENHDEQRIASDFFAGDPVKAFPAMAALAGIQSHALMIYAGQELGETGMEAEGFSGRDGRSTIFDYWSLSSLAAWKNNGLWNEAGLSGNQKQIRTFYRKLLHIHQQEKTFSEGVFYDLEYAQFNQPDFDTNKLYAFVRKAGRETVLCVLNFSDTPQNAQIHVPAHALEYLCIADDAEMPAMDLLTGENVFIHWKSDVPVKVTISASGVLILKGCLSS